MISLLGSALRFPLAPAVSKKAPMEAAMPTQMVVTSHLIYCICLLYTSEVFFRPLDPEELTYIAANGAKKGGLPIDKEALQLIAEYSENGRDAVNMVQMAVGLAEAGDKRFIEKGDVRFIIENGRYSRRYLPKAKPGNRIGCVYGLSLLHI